MPILRLPLRVQQLSASLHVLETFSLLGDNAAADGGTRPFQTVIDGECARVQSADQFLLLWCPAHEAPLDAKRHNLILVAPTPEDSGRDEMHVNAFDE
jgi:hypothetical protein